MAPERYLRGLAMARDIIRAVGSIEVGKRADFTVLAVDPLEVDAGTWPELEIVATVIERAVFADD